MLQRTAVSEIAFSCASLYYMLATEHLWTSTCDYITAVSPLPVCMPMFCSVLSTYCAILHIKHFFASLYTHIVCQGEFLKRVYYCTAKCCPWSAAILMCMIVILHQIL